MLWLLCDKPADGKMVGDGRAEGVDVLRRVFGHLTQDVEVKLRLGKAQVVGSKFGNAVCHKVLEQACFAEHLEELWLCQHA